MIPAEHALLQAYHHSSNFAACCMLCSLKGTDSTWWDISTSQVSCASTRIIPLCLRAFYRESISCDVRKFNDVFTPDIASILVGSSQVIHRSQLRRFAKTFCRDIGSIRGRTLLTAKLVQLSCHCAGTQESAVVTLFDDQQPRSKPILNLEMLSSIQSRKRAVYNCIFVLRFREIISLWKEVLLLHILSMREQWIW